MGVKWGSLLSDNEAMAWNQSLHPRLRWIPEHSIHMSTPKLRLAQSGSGKKKLIYLYNKKEILLQMKMKSMRTVAKYSWYITLSYKGECAMLVICSRRQLTWTQSLSDLTVGTYLMHHCQRSECCQALVSVWSVLSCYPPSFQVLTWTCWSHFPATETKN